MTMAFEPWNVARGAEIITEHAKLDGATLVILHALQEAFGYVPEPAIPMVATALNLSRAEVHGVFTFYHDFRKAPAGRHVLKLCRAEACQAAGGDTLPARGSKAWHHDRQHDGGRAGDAGADLLPRALRHRAIGHARRPRGRTA
jgi:NADH:ubiquinone oxidoreductase subunit E